MKLSEIENVVKIGREVRECRNYIKTPEILWPMTSQNYLSEVANLEILRIIKAEYTVKLSDHIHELAMLGVEVEDETSFTLNGKEKIIDGKLLTYEHIVRLSEYGPNMAPSVTYRNAGPDGTAEGILIHSQSIEVNAGTVVNCIDTNNA